MVWGNVSKNPEYKSSMKIHYLQSNRDTSILINCYPYSMCYTVAMTKLDNYPCYLNDISSMK